MNNSRHAVRRARRRHSAPCRPVLEKHSLGASAAAIGIVLVDLSGRVLACSEQAARLLGNDSADAIVGLAQLFDPARTIAPDGSCLSADDLPYAKAARMGTAQAEATLGICASEQGTRWLLVRAEPVFDVAGSPYAVVTRLAAV